jgi:RND family efflux transporter MFP subunit
MSLRTNSTDCAIVLALGGLLLASGCSQPAAGSAASAAEEPAPLVEVVRVRTASDPNSIRASGLVAFKRETALSFPAAGEIETLRVDVGDKVGVGQLIATLRRTSVGADNAEAGMVRDVAQKNYDRAKRLFDGGAASQSDLDAAQLALERTRGALQLKASASGVVLRRSAEVGQIAAAGQTIVSIGEENSGVVVRASASAAELARVAVGDAVDLEIRERPPLSGKVTRLAPKSADDTGVFQIEIQVDQPANLRSGEVAIAQLHPAGAKVASSVFMIPALALTDARADQGMVYVVGNDGLARRRAIQTAGITADGVTVLSGLADGEQVITRGAAMLREGQPVRVAKP